MTKQISLDNLVRLEKLLTEGGYASGDELITTLLDALDDHNRSMAKLRAALQVGFDQIEAGHVIPLTREWWDDLLNGVKESVERGDPIEFNELVWPTSF